MPDIPQMEPVIDEAERAAMMDYLDSGGWLTEYERTREFERRYAEYVGVEHASTMVNGTVSLVVALMALDVGRGDEVIVPDFTQIASVFAVDLVGATPVLIDVDPETLCLDLDRAEAAITDDTAAIVYVSLNGRSHDMRRVRNLSEDHDLYLLEDAAQALGSYCRDRQLGAWGDVGSYSFSYPKLITTGQGGMLVTDDEKLAERIGMIRDFGRPEAGVDRHDILGLNAKFTDMQAVIGIEQLGRADDRVVRKRDLFAAYRDRLDSLDGVEIPPIDLDQQTPWSVDVLVADGRRDALQTHLAEAGVDTRPFYPAIHTQAHYDGDSADYPVSRRLEAKGLWLPSSLTLSDADLQRICDEIEAFLEAA